MLSISPRRSTQYDTQTAHRGIIWENSRAFVPEWHRGPLNTGDSANVTVWKHQSINKTLLCRSKGFQHRSKRQREKKKKQQLRISRVSERKRPRVSLKRENCYHYCGKAKNVQNRKISPWEGIIKMVIFLLDTAAPLHYQNWLCL